jgi:hypothetical protein
MERLVLRVYENSGSGTLTVRVVTWAPATAIYRAPNSIAVITGTGMAAPALCPTPAARR